MIANFEDYVFDDNEVSTDGYFYTPEPRKIRLKSSFVKKILRLFFVSI